MSLLLFRMKNKVTTCLITDLVLHLVLYLLLLLVKTTYHYLIVESMSEFD